MRWWAAVVLGLFIVGCQPGSKDAAKQHKPELSVTVQNVVGKYVMDATPDEVAEAGGLDAMPSLVLGKDGSWKLKVDNETSTGTYQLEKGVLTLTDKDGSGQKFNVSEGGYRLDEQGDDPSSFVKLPDKT